VDTNAGCPANQLDRWSAFHISQSNPAGARQGNVPDLLRRVADTLDRLGSVQILDITFRAEPTAEEDDLRMTVYYKRSEEP
jgi:hypothetical protein